MINAQAHTPARTAPITPAQTKWEAFATRQPDRALWININRDRDSFAASLHSAVLRYGDLTERQGAAVDRNIERQVTRGKVSAEGKAAAMARINRNRNEPPLFFGGDAFFYLRDCLCNWCRRCFSGFFFFPSCKLRNEVNFFIGLF